MHKFKSRKFWLTLIATLSGIATTLMGVDGEVGIIAGMVVAVLPTIVYVITEGKIDAKAVGMVAEDITEVTEGIEKIKTTKKKKDDSDGI